MEKYITNNSLYLVGPIKDVISELKKLALEYDTVDEVISIYLN